MPMSSKTGQLRALLASGEFLQLPSSATPIEGRVAEAMGVKVVYTGGYATGASRGIGRAIRELLAEDGCDATLCALRGGRRRGGDRPRRQRGKGIRRPASPSSIAGNSSGVASYPRREFCLDFERSLIASSPDGSQ
jgi:hypothetical protein